MRITLVEKKGQVPGFLSKDRRRDISLASTGHHRLSHSQFHTCISNRRSPHLETRPRHPISPHLTSPHQPPNTTTPPTVASPLLQLPRELRESIYLFALLNPNNLSNTEHGSPTAPLPPPHQALLPSKTLRLGHQIPTSEPQTRPQPIAPINRRRHDASKIVVRTIAITTSSPTTTSTLPSTLNLVPLRRRTMQLRRCATLATQSHRNHHRTTSSHALAAVARHVPIRLGIDPSIAPLSEVVGGARR
jgi:hypothetical protein